MGDLPLTFAFHDLWQQRLNIRDDMGVGKVNKDVGTVCLGFPAIGLVVSMRL
jgi:hypothetical protein